MSYHGKSGKFSSKASAHTVSKGGERFKVVRQYRRIKGSSEQRVGKHQRKMKSHEKVVEVVEAAKLRAARVRALLGRGHIPVQEMVEPRIMVRDIVVFKMGVENYAMVIKVSGSKITVQMPMDGWEGRLKGKRGPIELDTKQTKVTVTKRNGRPVLEAAHTFGALSEEPHDWYKDYRSGTITKKQYDQMVANYERREREQNQDREWARYDRDVKPKMDALAALQAVRYSRFTGSISDQVSAGRTLSDKQKKAVRRMFYQAKMKEKADLFR
jgi:hypothetical protein